MNLPQLLKPKNLYTGVKPCVKNMMPSSITPRGPLSYFLGVEATFTSSGLLLSQRKYIQDLLSKTNMQDAKEVITPLSTNESLKLYDGSPVSDATQYRQVLGSLQYLALTRPDISFAVNKLSQFMHQLSTTHWSAVKRILRYLKGTLHHGMFLRKHTPLNLHTFVDVNWAGNFNDRTSTSGYIIFLGANPINWSSKKQKIVARSTTEAEYRAIAITTTELNWVTNLLKELNVNSTLPPTIYCDNIGATYLCVNPVFHSRMKYIAIDFHFVRDQVVRYQLRVSHIWRTPIPQQRLGYTVITARRRDDTATNHPQHYHFVGLNAIERLSFSSEKLVFRIILEAEHFGVFVKPWFEAAACSDSPSNEVDRGKRGPIRKQQDKFPILETPWLHEVMERDSAPFQVLLGTGMEASTDDDRLGFGKTGHGPA
ncbi:Retrotransposon protein [Musa troglodytarum]|uniref:Retrotransposon protein n=1 Tax=Musa troglodytarum TaxID=320322 RepID=A0A9E7JT09_9LILI|nr:Retrotransposon protein [Musa troglodytarum]